MSDVAEIIQQLRARRQEAKLTFKALSEISGYHDNTIWQWEKGHATPSFRSLHDWAEALGMKLTLERRDD